MMLLPQGKSAAMLAGMGCSRFVTPMLSMLQTMIKQRRESIELYAKGGRTDLVDQEKGEIEIIERFLPKRIQKRVSTLARNIVTLPATEAVVDSQVLSQLALACEQQQRVRFGYRDHAGHESSRECEPYRVVHDGRRWYLIAWDLARSDFRTFRVDRVRATFFCVSTS